VTPLNSALEYSERANTHRPTTPEAMAVAVRQLRAQGLTRRDVASALSIAIDEVINLEKLK